MEHSLNDVASVKRSNEDHPKILAKKSRSGSTGGRSSKRASKSGILHQPYQEIEKHESAAPENPAGAFEVVTFLPNAEGREFTHLWNF